jgi:hypothetical protein
MLLPDNAASEKRSNWRHFSERYPTAKEQAWIYKKDDRLLIAGSRIFCPFLARR